MTAHIKGTENRSHFPPAPIESRTGRHYSHSDRAIASLLDRAERSGTITLANGRTVSCDKGLNSAHKELDGELPNRDRPTMLNGIAID